MNRNGNYWNFTYNNNCSPLINLRKWFQYKMWNLNTYTDDLLLKYIPGYKINTGFNCKSSNFFKFDLSFLPAEKVLFWLDIYTTIFSFIISFLFLSLFFFIAIIFFIKLSVFYKNFILGLPLQIKFVNQSSDDVNSKNLFATYILFLTFSLAYIYSITFFNFLIGLICYVTTSLFILTLIQLFFIPTKLLHDMGYAYIIFLKGSSTSKIFLKEYVADSISLLSYYLRVIIQFVRIIILLVLFFTYHELYEHYVLPFNSFSLEDFSLEFNLNLFFITSFLVKFILYWLYECVHFLIIFIIQYSVFSLMLFTLISFLYLQTSIESIESAYVKYRKCYFK